MEYFIGIDLHSNNSYVAVIDEKKNIIFKQKMRQTPPVHIIQIKMPIQIQAFPIPDNHRQRNNLLIFDVALPIPRPVVCPQPPDRIGILIDLPHFQLPLDQLARTEIFRHP